jgi:hypothetical protein
MKLARHDLVAALSLRYDHYSSQSLFEAACKRANLDDQESYTAAEVAAFRAALAKLGDRLQRVDARLDSLLGTSEPDEDTAQVSTPAPKLTVESAATHAEGSTASAKPPKADSAKPTNASPAGSKTESTNASPAGSKTASANAPPAGSKTESANAPPAGSKTDAANASPADSKADAANAPPAGSKTESAKPANASTAPAKPGVATPAHAPQATPPMPAPDGLASAAPRPAPSTESETRIVLTGIELADGDALFVCGDRVELGNWDPERARPMMRDGDAWIAVVPRGEGVFKFLRRTEDGDVTWEAGDNREIGMAAKIETSWQSHGLD